MGSFRYRALSETGAIVDGELDADSEREAVEKIRALGHYPIAASAADVSDWRKFLAQEVRFGQAPRQRDLALATRELATLLDAGLEIDYAIETVGTLGEMERLRPSLTAIVARLRGGATLADALAAEKVFPKFYVSLVRAGETGGSLSATLGRLAAWLERAEATRQAVTSALVYPIILLVTTGLSILLILLFVLPEFEPLFTRAGQNLPFATRVVMEAGHVIGAYGWAMALLVIGVVVWLRHRLAQPGFRRKWDALKLRLPLFGDLALKIELERFSRTLGTLLQNGVALPSALAITRDTLGNAVIAAAVDETLTSLREGDTLSSRLARTGIFPAVALDLIRIGEQTGKLEDLLLRQADMYEHGLRHTIDRMLALLVPVLTLFLGIVVAGVIGSILVAILSVNELAF